MSYTSKDVHMNQCRVGPKMIVKSWGDTPRS